MPSEDPAPASRFIADQNVGRLARWLRAMGFDTVFFGAGDDSKLVSRARREGRTILTRDAGIMKRRLITSGRLPAILIASPNLEEQLRQVIATFKLERHFRPFTICLECNQPLVEKSREDVKGRVPPYVFRTQSRYLECPVCHRLYWRGTHWAAMTRKLKKLAGEQAE